MGTMLIVAAEQVSGAHVMRARHKNGLSHLQILGTQRKKRLMRLRSENLMYGCLREYVLLCVTW